MSTGKIVKPKKTTLLDNQRKSSEIDFMYSIIESCEVVVDDKSLKENSRKHYDSIKQIKIKIDDIEKKLNSKQIELSLITKLKENFKELSSRYLEIKNQIISINNEIQNLIETRNKINEIEINQNENSKIITKLSNEVDKLKAIKSVELKISVNDNIAVTLSKQHKSFEILLKIIGSKLNAYIVGPAGSGKTTAAKNCAKVLGVNFYFTGAISSEYKLTGFIDAQGKIVSTDFRKAYENGGLFLFDEIDASYPQALLAFNAALANDFMDFPDGRINRHKDFYCIAAANTFGLGADRMYIGRNQLDAASVDRFVFVDWSYDKELEREIAGDNAWVVYVQAIRNVVDNLKIRHVVSPRASIYGAKLLKSGLSKSQVEDLVIWKGLDNATIEKIKSNL